jgi:multidrug resistance efflux pump
MAAFLVLPVVAWRFLPGGSNNADPDAPMLHVVEKGDFVHDIAERGAVESASNIEVRCQVQAQNSAGTRILEVVAEGTYVKEGDMICRLDSSALENDRLKQMSVVENANAAKIQAESDHETAAKSLDEYLKGKYEIDKAQILADLQVAEENERRAKDTVRYSKQLLEKGYITKLQLDADEFALKKAETDKRSADLKKEVLDKYTKEKMLVQLKADINSTEAKLKAQVNTWELEKQRLKLIEEQIAKCMVLAPANGQVVYANNTERMGGQEIIIEEGAVVRERQVLVRLPDPKRMQVKAKINESKIATVREGQTAVIRLDALPDQELDGIVRKVNEYPVQGGWLSANIKEYETTVEILGSPTGLRPGLNAEVRIRVAQLANVVQIPVQAILAQGDRTFCFVRARDDWELRQVEVGSTNDKTIVVKKNLESGETVALNAASLRELYDLPEAPAKPQPKVLLASAEPGASPGGGAGEKREGKPGDATGAAAAPGGPREDRKRRAGPPGADKSDPAAVADQTFRQLDKDSDGRLSKADLSEPMRARFAAMDKNGDGFIDRQEWTAAMRTVAVDARERKPRTRGG